MWWASRLEMVSIQPLNTLLNQISITYSEAPNAFCFQISRRWWDVRTSWSDVSSACRVTWTLVKSAIERDPATTAEYSPDHSMTIPTNFYHFNGPGLTFSQLIGLTWKRKAGQSPDKGLYVLCHPFPSHPRSSLIPEHPQCGMSICSVRGPHCKWFKPPHPCTQDWSSRLELKLCGWSLCLTEIRPAPRPRDQCGTRPRPRVPGHDDSCLAESKYGPRRVITFIGRWSNRGSAQPCAGGPFRPYTPRYLRRAIMTPATVGTPKP